MRSARDVAYQHGAALVGEPLYETTSEAKASSFTPAFYVAAEVLS
ncbi:MAG TPA: hypothetical protein VKG38_00055 [Solirubrobacteraceae bacterium]|nr:hypothetical protein [Solirubrobacteraceae bacterium]